ncbi:uncharacterized protein K452DRAFT_275951 [Neofusicoccum parvum]|nr:uncharacterized protein K452DRAFT_275951 [Neofusicoccum parvum]
MWIDPRVEFVAADFLEPPQKVSESLKSPCKDVTHVYFTSYVHNDDLSKLAEKNVPLFKNFMDVMEQVCPKLERVCLQTGGKHYGLHLGPTKQPVTEDIGRYEDEGLNFYYQQEDYMREAQQRRKQWSYNVIRPFGIIGYTPQANGMNMSMTWAIYLLICKELGIAAGFPGSQVFLDAADDISYSPSIADMTLWATTNDHTKNKDFNHASGDPVVFRYFWRELAAYFGIQIDEVALLGCPLSEWIKDKRGVWERIVQKYGGSVEAFDSCNWQGTKWADMRQWQIFPSVTKARRYGWSRYDTAMECWSGTFKTFENAGILPKSNLVRNG